jgi:Ca2+-binding EF-hand superfamily protein
MLSNQSLDIKSYLKQELIDVALALFKKFDKGAKGSIEAKDLGTMLRLLDFNPTERELREMIDKLEEDPSNPTGLITKEGFLVCVAKKAKEPDTIEELINCFKLFDREGSGCIEEKDLRFILCKMGDGLTDDEMDNLMKEAVTSFVDVVNDVKLIRYVDFALYLKDMYVPPKEEVKPKPGKK